MCFFKFTKKLDTPKRASIIYKNPDFYLLAKDEDPAGPIFTPLIKK